MSYLILLLRLLCCFVCRRVQCRPPRVTFVPRVADREKKGNAPGDDVNPNKRQLQRPTRAPMMKSARIGRIRVKYQ